MYFIYYFASPDQYGQNLYCFSGVDSIGNQGSSTCLRFIIESPAILMNPLYTQNVTRYPIGVVTSVTSTWTILTDGIQYPRPTIESYIRFKRLSDNSDIFRLNVVTETSNVLYLDDRLVISSNIIWTPGEQYYIYFDSGILALASTCTKASMPIIDPAFWPFRIPYETTSSTTTSTSTTSGTSTLRPRTVPSQRTIISRTTTTRTTVTVTTGTEGSTTKSTVPAVKKPASHLTISEIIAITLATALFLVLSSKILVYCVHFYIIQAVVLRHGLQKQIYDFMPIDQSIQSTTQYKLALNKRARTYACQGKTTSSLALVDIQATVSGSVKD
ncbi:unnamed protein product [Adineta ricciae]|nr:unnamed protein product [Adineta ricciae]